MPEPDNSMWELSNTSSAAENAPAPVPTPEVEKPAEVAAPEEKPTVAADAPPAKPEEAPAVDASLFELPDGRKVDAATLTKEWKENFLPEFTRKSQILAQYERQGAETKPPEDTQIKKPDASQVPKWKDPDYVPQSYAEIIELAEQAAMDRLANEASQEEARLTAVTQEVDRQIGEVKKLDPSVDENALFQHANKYHFNDLVAAHANMRDMRQTELQTEQRVLKDVKTREVDPVSDAASAQPVQDDSVDMNSISTFRSAGEYLERIRNK